MDSTQIVIFESAFMYGVDFGTSLIPGFIICSVLIVVAKLVRSI